MDVSLVEPFVNFLLSSSNPVRWRQLSRFTQWMASDSRLPIDLALNDLRSEQPLRPWPDDAPMAIAVTHDVDLFDGLSLLDCGLQAGPHRR